MATLQNSYWGDLGASPPWSRRLCQLCVMVLSH